MLRTQEEKLAIVREHLEEGYTIQELSQKHGIHIANIKYYVALYKRHGSSAFENSEEIKVYTREYKLKAIKRYLNGDESMQAISIDLGLKDPSILKDWINKYEAGGEDAIQVSTGRKNYLLHEERQDKIASDELKEHIKYLEAENEYPKKSYSLILERNRQSKKK